MFKAPDDRVQDKLKLGGWDGKEGEETVRVDSLQEQEEVGAVLRILFKVLVDHVQSALKDSVKDLRDLLSDVASQLIDNYRHGTQHLGLSSRWNVALVVEQYSIEERRNKIVRNLWHVHIYFINFKNAQIH